MLKVNKVEPERRVYRVETATKAPREKWDETVTPVGTVRQELKVEPDQLDPRVGTERTVDRAAMGSKVKWGLEDITA